MLYTKEIASASDLCRALASGPMPKLWLPSPEDFVLVDAIPVLGSGKIDLRALRTIAEERMGFETHG